MQLDPARTVRVLRAKAAEHEGYLAQLPPERWTDVDYLRADVSLLADLLADAIERLMDKSDNTV